MIFAVRAAYPEEDPQTWGERIRALQPTGWVEVAFANPGLFQTISIDAVIEPVLSSGVRVVAVHMAYARVLDQEQFVTTLERTTDVADALDSRLIIAHPNRGRLSDVLSFLDDEISPLLQSRGKILCWEVFDGRRRILDGLENVVDFCKDRPSFRVCYDFSHGSENQSNVERETREQLEWIEHFHLSNRVRSGRIQHLPVFWNEEAGGLGRDLDLVAILRGLAEEGYGGALTLEYQSQFDSHLVPDAVRLAGMFGG
jgi:sugar phosphate isomerase/epimerase